MKHAVRYLAGILLAAGSTAASAEPPTTDRHGRAVEQVIVSATRSPQTELNIATPITVITADDIVRSGAGHLIDILQSQAGIQIQDRIGNGSRASVSMRGFADAASNNTLILVDGRRLNNPTMEAADLSSIPVHDIERIEIIQGSAGVLFGEQAVGGVINIITRRPDTPQLRVEAGLGSHDLRRTRASFSQAWDTGLALRLSGEKRQTDNYRDNNESDYGSLLAQLDYRGERGSAFVEFQHRNDDLNQPGAISDDSVWAPPPQLSAEQKMAIRRQQTANPLDYFDIRTDVARFGGSLQLGTHWTLAGEYSDRDSDGKGFVFGGEFRQNTRVQNLSPRLLGEWQTTRGPLLLTLGFDQQDSAFDYSQPSPWPYFLHNEQRMKDGYLQLVLPLARGLSFNVGARHSAVEDEDLLTGLSERNSELATEAGLSWQLAAHSRLFVRNADGFRFATVDENGLTPPGQPFLDPQTSNSWDLGYEWQHAGHSLRLLAFDMRLDNEIIFDPSAPGLFFPGTNINLDASRRRGAVAEGRWALTEALALRTNYSYTDAHITSGTFRGNAVPFVARHSGALALEMAFGNGWSAYVDGQYTGSRRQGGDDANAAAQIDRYWVYNANLRWQHRQWETNLRINNLSGKRYDSYRSIYGVYPAAERTAELRLAYHF